MQMKAAAFADSDFIGQQLHHVYTCTNWDSHATTRQDTPQQYGVKLLTKALANDARTEKGWGDREFRNCFDVELALSRKPF
jgi:hypothetical protein